MICALKQISKMYGGTGIFENLSVDIRVGERIGLVGRNGGGKTTILKIIAGVEQADTGDVILKKGTKVGYLAQIPVFDQHVSAYDVLMEAYKEVTNLKEQLQILEKEMAAAKDENDLQKMLEKYGAIQDQFGLLGGYEAEANADAIANGLGIAGLLHSPFHSLSGGEKTKVCLGMILLLKPDLLLLDEPTNHLDISAVEWLEKYLKEYQGTVITVSHDRYFLDEVVTKIIDLEDGEASIYNHNYSDFVVEKEKRLLDEFQNYQEQQKKIKKMKEAIKRLREWANQANPPNAGLHKKANNMQKALDRMEKLKRPVLERKRMGLQFDAADRSGKDVIILDHVGKGFNGKAVVNGVNIFVRYNERVAIVGNNGTGKTTLLKMVNGELMPDTGKVMIGANVKAGYLSQHLFTDPGKKTVLETFREHVPVTEGEARNILAGFLFYGPAVFRKVSQLSGGERMRLRLAQLMHQDVNLLILDEPTNHLDIDSREILELALEDFNGTILAVSHDRYLLNKLFDRTYWIEDGHVIAFDGGYSWARQKLDEHRQLERGPKGIKVTKSAVQRNNKEQSLFEELEQKIYEAEDCLKELDRLMEEEKHLEQLAILYNRRSEMEGKLNELYEKLDLVQ